MEVIENWLSKDLNDYLNIKFTFNTPHFYGHSSNSDGKNMFYFCDLSKDPFVDFLAFKLRKTLKLSPQATFKRSYINVQHPNMDGVFHEDDGDLTVIYMPSEADKGGSFQYKKNDEILEIPYTQNKLIFFDSKVLHRGLSFKNYPRVTLAFKISYNA